MADVGRHRSTSPRAPPASGLVRAGRLLVVGLVGLVAVGAVVAVLQAITGNLVTTVATAGLLVPVGAAVAYFVVMFRSPKVTAPERTHLRAYIPLWIGAVLFFMITEQAAGKMATFADSNTDLRLPLFGWSITAEAYQSVNPAAIVILAPLIGMLFTRRAGRFPSTIMKFVIAVLIVGLSALMLGYGFQIWPGGEHLSPWWFLALVYVIQTVAELFLSPVGLSTTSALAPKNFASQTMSLWLLTTATGQGLAGFIISRTEHVANSTYYYGLGAATLLMALVLFAVAPWTQRQMADVEVAAQIHGESGLDGVELPDPTVPLAPGHAVSFIIDTVMAAEPGEITLVATGPLTNIALAARIEPRIVGRIAELVVMGGGFHEANWTPAAEFNIWVDPEAARIVFEESWPITMVGLDLTHQALATAEAEEGIRRIGSELSEAFLGLMAFFRRAYKENQDFDDPPVHDPCTIAYLIDPAIVRTRRAPVRIETHGQYTTGATVVDLRGQAPENVHTQVATELDHAGFWRLMTEAIAALS